MEVIKKNILLLSTGDTNGAYEYVFRLSKVLIRDGHKVVMLVKNKSKYDDFLIQYNLKYVPPKHKFFLKILNKIKSIFVGKRKTNIDYDLNYDFISRDEKSENVSIDRIIEQINFIPDFVFVGMTDFFMNSTDLYNLYLKTNSKIYNISVDMNHFTGGCHYAWDCLGYINGCGDSCPAILSEDFKGIAKVNFNKKIENAHKGNFRILTGSGWTLKQSKESKIYKHQKNFYNINSLIDTEILNNRNKDISKRIFNLNNKDFYILMGSQNNNAKRKGFDYLVESLKLLYLELNEFERERIQILIVSRTNSSNFKEIPFKKKYLPYIKDYKLLSLLYQASNLFVNSSIEDSGPMMVTEALACGTPVVGFDMGVVNNMVVNDYNGYKAKLADCKDLMFGINKIFKLNKEDFLEYSNNATQHVENFSSFNYASKILKDLLQD